MISDSRPLGWQDLTHKAISRFLEDENLVSQIIELGQPLTKANINGLFYGEYYNHQRNCLVGNRPDWLNYWKEKCYQASTYSGKDVNKFTPGKTQFCFDQFANSQSLLDLFDHQMRSGIYYFNTSLDGQYTEFFLFTLNQSYELGHAYLRSIEPELLKYMAYFKEKALPIIQSSRLPKDLYIENNNPTLPVLCGCELNVPESKKYILNYPFNDVTLTHKQFVFLRYLLQGFTNKEIAKIISISPRTVEKHFELIKQKLNCDSRKTLFHKLLNSNLITELIS